MAGYNGVSHNPWETYLSLKSPRDVEYLLQTWKYLADTILDYMRAACERVNKNPLMDNAPHHYELFLIALRPWLPYRDPKTGKIIPRHSMVWSEVWNFKRVVCFPEIPVTSILQGIWDSNSEVRQIVTSNIEIYLATELKNKPWAATNWKERAMRHELQLAGSLAQLPGNSRLPNGNPFLIANQ